MTGYTTHTAYCSACDRPVQISVRPGYLPIPGEPIPHDAVLCHGVGHWCTGALCPLFGVEPAEMRERAEQSGIATER